MNDQSQLLKLAILLSDEQLAPTVNDYRNRDLCLICFLSLSLSLPKLQSDGFYYY